MRELVSSSLWIEEAALDTFIPPILYTPPPDWLRWASEMSGVEEARTAVSKNMNADNSIGWAQWIALKAALMGYIENPDAADLGQVILPQRIEAARAVIDWSRQDEARQTREAFEKGRPIPIPMIVSVERFTSFVPVVCNDSATKTYTVGRDKTKRQFSARHHSDALGKAAMWYSVHEGKAPGIREKEIAARRELADKQAEKLPLTYLDLATMQLEYDGLLLTEQGDLTAMLGWGHGFYLVCSERWCYSLRISAGPAAKLAILSALEDKARLLLRVDELPVFAGLEGWQAESTPRLKPGGSGGDPTDFLGLSAARHI